MERPFFSLAKRKRLRPIEYKSPNGDIFVNVFPNHEFGMATIWDADILIWTASTLREMLRKGVNDLPRTLNFQPYDVLKTIGRATGGREYKLLRDALGRLQSTTIVTNIRVRRGKKHRQFSWIESWTDLVDEETNQSRGMSLTLSDWLYEGIVMNGGVLAIDPAYFSISGGRERWLYRVARKHAGGAGEGGFAISLPTLFQKSGAEGTYRRFKFEIQRIVARDDLPEFRCRLVSGSDEPSLQMIRRDELAPGDSLPGTTRRRSPPRKVAAAEQLPQSIPLLQHLADETIERVRRDFPGWDVYALKEEFDAWLSADVRRMPRDYQAAFYGFVRRHLANQGASPRS
jgi:plasmid replication initiation protein